MVKCVENFVTKLVREKNNMLVAPFLLHDVAEMIICCYRFRYCVMKIQDCG